MSWEEIRKTISGFATLEDGWDSYGAPAPDRATIDKATRWTHFLEKFAVPPTCRAVAGPWGEIVLEWQDEGVWRELDIVADSPVRAMARPIDRSGPYWHSGAL